MTLGGLAVAVGRVVDDAIVVLENIYRHRSRGEARLSAVLTGAREVSGAITASTATTVMVFLPLGFVGGLVSQFFLPFALTVTFALLASLVCALTVVPVLAYFLVDRVKVDVDELGEPRRSIWVRIYSPTITWALSSRLTRWAVVGGAGLLFVGSLALLPYIPTQFINSGGEKILAVSIQPPAGTSSTGVLDRTDPGRGRSSTPTPTSSSSNRPFQARATRAPSRSRPRSPVGPPTAPRSSSGSTLQVDLGTIDRADRRPALTPLDQTAGTSPCPRPAASPAAGSTSSSARPIGRPSAQRQRGHRRRPRARAPISSTSRATSRQAASTVEVNGGPEQGARRRPDHRPGGRRAPQCARPESGDPGSDRRSAGARRLCPGRPGERRFRRGPARPAGRNRSDRAPWRDRCRRPDRGPGQRHPDRREARLVDLGRDHERRHRRRVAGGRGRGQSAHRCRGDPRERRRHPGRGDPAAERGVRWVVRVDGRRRSCSST